MRSSHEPTQTLPPLGEKVKKPESTEPEWKPCGDGIEVNSSGQFRTNGYPLPKDPS